MTLEPLVHWGGMGRERSANTVEDVVFNLNFTLNQLQAALSGLKIWNALRPDQITDEMLKNLGKAP